MRAGRLTWVWCVLLMASLLGQAVPAVGQVAADADGDGDDDALAGELAHVPVVSSYPGEAIVVEATQRCDVTGDCSADLLYRISAAPDTPTDEPLPHGSTDLPLRDGWTRVEMARVAEQITPDEDLLTWRREIPAEIVGTRGIDYLVETRDDGVQGRFPAGTDQSAVTHNGFEPGFTWWHVNVLSPPLLHHTPPRFGMADSPLPLDLHATCARPSCTATVYWRVTPDSGVTSVPLTEVPQDWRSAVMPLSGSAVEHPDAPGRVDRWTYVIPASDLDTRGLDYFFHVTDGETNAWWPGTTHQGYYAPRDGMRTGYAHLHVLEPPHIVHAPVATSPYRADVSISAEATCPAQRECTAMLYWRTTTTHIGADDEVFESSTMTVSVVQERDDADVISLGGVIPGSAADTRGMDYFIGVSDGSTDSWWPGTSQIDGYAPVPGTRVGYQHIRVLDPPHIVPSLPGVARTDEELAVEADVSCSTEACSVTLFYRADSDAAQLEEVTERSLVMARVGEATQLSQGVRLERYRAVIPAGDITTAGLGLRFHATDGFVDAHSPGTDYWGAYIPLNGAPPSEAHRQVRVNGVNADVGVAVVGVHQQVGPPPVGNLPHTLWPVHIVEPPHPVHVPPTAVEAGSPVATELFTTCTTRHCTGLLEWWDSARWRSVAMQGGPVSDPEAALPATLARAEDVWRFSGVLPSEATDREQVEYRFTVDDGHVRVATPTTFTAITTTTAPGVSGNVAYSIPAGPGRTPATVPAQGVNVMAITDPVAALGLPATPVVVAQGPSDADGTYRLGEWCFSGG